MSTPYDLEAVAARFKVTGELVAAEPFRGGHINDSFLLTCRRANGSVRFLLQRINHAVFSNPMLLMENVQRVTDHVASALESQGTRDIDRRVLRLVRTHEDTPCHGDDAGSCWRLYRFIENTRTYEVVETAPQAEQAGRAFGAFQQLLADLPVPLLHETIPDFHNTPLRFEALERAVQADTYNRAAMAKDEIDVALSRRWMAGLLLDLHEAGEIPKRAVHNDAKINNVLFDEDTDTALCVVDLDTVMPGLAPYDFGDMVRSMTSLSREDERDLSKVEVQMPLFEAIARGYLEEAGALLTPAERAHLVPAGKLITLEQGVRFLTDFLNGDVYYKTQRPGQNLDRCRTQLELVESIERHEPQMTRFIETL